MQARRDSEHPQDDSAKNLGLLYTGYLDKRNPVNGSYRTRFVVLTHEFVHWFKRSSVSVELFGEERGHVGLDSILSVRVIDEDSTCFEVQSTDNTKRYFRGSSPLVSEEWVSAIRSAIKGFADKDSRQTDKHDNGAEVLVNLVTLKSKLDDTELVISRNPSWDRIINVPIIKKGDSLLLTTTNGGSVLLSSEFITLKAEDGLDFEVSVQSVPLASCLRLSICKCLTMSEKKETSSAGNIIASFIARGTSLASTLTMHQGNSLTFVLSIMVLLVGSASSPHLSDDTSLFFLFAGALSLHCILRMFYDMAKNDSDGGSEFSGMAFSISLTIRGHTFTAADAPLGHDDEIPKRFIDGCEGDLKEARRRWDITRRWREAEGVDKVLETKQPYFSHIKSLYPFYHAGRGREGHVVFYERPGDLESAQLAARGIVTEDLLKHWIFVTEYQWVVMAGGDEAAKGIAVIDVGTVKMGDLAGDNLEYVRKTIGYANAHYPERSYVIYLVNAPYWFSLLWQIVRPMVHPNTQAKVRILTKGATLKGLQEHIDISNIPEFYGGQLDFGGHDSCRFQSPEVVELNNFVQRINEGVPQPKNNFDENVVNSSPSPPGRPGEHYNAILNSRSTDSLASRSVVELDAKVNSLNSARSSGVKVQTYPSDNKGNRRNKQGRSMFSASNTESFRTGAIQRALSED